MNRARRILSGWALVAFGLMVPLGAQALGLGEARVESFLNQPLDVRMRLLDVSDSDLDSLTVAPADPADYERLGLMSESLGLRLEVRVDRSVSPPVVHVTSERSVTDPVVQLLINARWANGRVLREYTLFLDPATVAVDAPAPAPAQSPPSRARDPEPRSRTAPDPAPRPSSAPAPTQPQSQQQPQSQPRAVARSGDDRYGPVASGETLWSIARDNLPSGDVTMDQMMIAIVELNPRAFRDGNINRLLRGAELRLPEAEQARTLDEAVAAAEVAAQNRAFRQRTAADTPVVSASGRTGAGGTEERATADATGRAAGQTESRAEAGDEAGDPRLSLVPPGEEESGSGLSDAEASEVADLRQRLARAEEELYAVRQEAEEFQAQVEELEAMVRNSPGGMGIQDADLAGLERTLRAAREATREGADPAVRSRVSRRLDNYLEEFAAADEGGDSALADASGETPGADDSSEAAAGTPAAGTSQAETPDSQSDAGAAPAPEPEPEQAESPADSPGLFGNPMLVLFVGLVVLLLLLAAVRFGLRRRRAAEGPGPLEPEVPASPKPATDADAPLARARDRVKSQPTDLGAHLGLLETLAAEDNEDRFGDALEEMFEHVETGDEPEWREALELAGRIVPGHSLVKGSSDWVSGSDEAGASEAASELDEESEVDDLMSRLDADLDESDDREWLGEEAAEKPAPDGPLLRDDEDSSPKASSDRDEGSFRFTGTEVLDPKEFDEDSPVDSGDWGDTDEEAASDRASDGDDGDADLDELILDWDAAEDKTGDAGAPATPADESASSAGAEAEDEDNIFAHSDDDIDVKLDLAKAYLTWNSTESARTLLEEVEREGNESQQQEARKLLEDAAGEDED